MPAPFFLKGKMMVALRDIRKNLPLTPQTDPNKFPMYEFRPYPRMMTYEEGKKKIPYKGADGHPVIVNSAGEEQAFMESIEGKKPEEAPAKTAAIPQDEPAQAPVTLNTLAEKRKPGPKPRLPATLT